YFGEGITLWGERIIQLTWQSRIGFVYDKESFRPLQRFFYPHEGWGITQDGKRLIVSDGTEKLRFWNPVSFQLQGILSVQDEQGHVIGLNELEYIRGAIYANVWPTNRIVVIDPDTGRVRERFELPALLSETEAKGVDVPNGIAYDPRSDRLWVTGKLWPRLFELQRRRP
ncbi:MAG: glutaminyl-peptide cyclotransferase, partial [Syntrophaceae bacterium]|nr:glutaminyl-peptide cyclotransferase [Syntrophaceae bacterium]